MSNDKPPVLAHPNPNLRNYQPAMLPPSAMVQRQNEEMARVFAERAREARDAELAAQAERQAKTEEQNVDDAWQSIMRRVWGLGR